MLAPRLPLHLVPHKSVVHISLALTALITGTSHAQSSFTAMGDLAGGIYYSRAMSVSGDGTVVVGDGDGASGQRATRWTTGGLASLGVLAGGTYSRAIGVNSDGSVVVGQSDSTGGIRAFRWTSGGMVDLGTLPGGNFSSARATSSDGSVVVGQSATPNGNRAFRWTGGVMTDLGIFGGTGVSVAYGVSSDGTVVVGSAQSTNGNRAFRWTSGGMVDLGTLAGDAQSLAYGVSGDGAVVVGDSKSAGNVSRAFRWTASGMTSLGTLTGGTFSYANATNSDGSVVVGQSGSSSGNRAFRWTQAGGMQSVADWLTGAGVTVAANFVMTYASGVSSDGSVVVGYGTNASGTEGFIARVTSGAGGGGSSGGSGVITLSQVQNSLASVSNGSSMTLSSASTLINGAHSRPLAKRVAPGQKAFWVAGDWGTDNHGSRNGDLGLAELGGGMHWGPVQLNAALGQTWSRQNMVENGRAESQGAYLLAEAIVPLSEKLWTTVGAYYNWGKADIRRGYLNAGLPDSSRGKPNVSTWGLRARLDMDSAYTVAGADFSPYVDLNYNEAKLDAYTETGGGFPARFDERKEAATEMRVGVSAKKPMDHGGNWVSTFEMAHRFEESGSRTVGQMIGLFSFNLNGVRYQQDWLRAGIGMEKKLMGGTGSVMLNATTLGEAATHWLAAAWQMTF